MNKTEIIKLLADVLHSNVDDIDSIRSDVPLSDIGLDSLSFVEFIVALENKYNIEVYDSDLIFENFASINAIFSTLEKYFTHKRLYKCIITDCDGVLWDGVAGESGSDSVYFNKRNKEYLSILKKLRNKGVYVCICTRNTENCILSTLSQTSLSEEDFAVIETNADDKSLSIKSIISKLGISESNTVYVDDSDYELGLVSSVLPGITVVKACYKDNFFIQYISGFFENIPKTDIDRTNLYREQKEREKVKLKIGSIDEYNTKIRTVIKCGIAPIDEAERIAELSQRTNRFNLSGKRYNKEEIEKYITYNTVISLSASDIFGNMGLIAAAIVKDKTIDNFMLSCRAFGRGFETVLINKVKELCGSDLIGIYNMTNNNKEQCDFYNRNLIFSN